MGAEGTKFFSETYPDSKRRGKLRNVLMHHLGMYCMQRVWTIQSTYNAVLELSSLALVSSLAHWCCDRV
jgi:hypothetical protein